MTNKKLAKIARHEIMDPNVQFGGDWQAVAPDIYYSSGKQMTGLDGHIYLEKLTVRDALERVTIQGDKHNTRKHDLNIGNTSTDTREPNQNPLSVRVDTNRRDIACEIHGHIIPVASPSKIWLRDQLRESCYFKIPFTIGEE